MYRAVPKAIVVLVLAAATLLSGAIVDSARAQDFILSDSSALVSAQAVAWPEPDEKQIVSVDPIDYYDSISATADNTSFYGTAHAELSLVWSIDEINGSGRAMVLTQQTITTGNYTQAYAIPTFNARFYPDAGFNFDAYVSKNGGPAIKTPESGSKNIQLNVSDTSVTWWFNDQCPPGTAGCPYKGREKDDDEDYTVVPPTPVTGSHLIANGVSALLSDGDPPRYATERSTVYSVPVILPSPGGGVVELGLGVDSAAAAYFEAPAESQYLFNTDGTNNFRSFEVPAALAGGDTTFALVAEGQQFFFGPDEVIDFTTINPEGIDYFVFGVDVTESITPEAFDPFVLAMSFMSHGAATFAALPIVATYEADFDMDGDVDADDLPVWQGDYGSVDLADTYITGDADGDGDADGQDFLLWQQQFGSGVTSPLASQVVPEPSTLALLLLGLATTAFRLRSIGNLRNRSWR